MKEVTVDEAIEKGKLYIILPFVLILIICLIISIYFNLKYFSDKKYLIIVFTLMSSAIAILYSLFAIPKWKIWAFGNVRNVHELKKKAQYKNLLYKENSWIEKLEFFSNSDREKWDVIQKKFIIPDETKDDKNIPNEVVIFNSEFKLLIPIVFYSLFFIGIIISMVSDKNMLGIGFMLLTVFGLFLYFDIIRFSKRKIPLLVINQNGIRNQDGDFFYWKDITNERLFKTLPYKNIFYLHFLCFDKINENVRIEITYIKMNKDKLFNIFLVFKDRFNKQNNK